MTMMIPESSFSSSKPVTLMDIYRINKAGSIGSRHYEVIEFDGSGREIYIANVETE